MNICFLCLRSFLNRRERGSILETVGGRSGVLERLTRNQKPIPHLSVFMVTNGRSRNQIFSTQNFTLLSSPARNYFSKDCDHSKGKRKKKRKRKKDSSHIEPRKENQMAKLDRLENSCGATPLDLISHIPFQKPLDKNIFEFRRRLVKHVVDIQLS